MSKIITNTEANGYKNGYKNGDNIEGKMFPKLWSLG